MPLEIQDGRVIGVTATAGCTAGAIWAGAEIAGVYLDTYAASSTNTNVPVALEGVFTVTRKANVQAWAAGTKVYTLTTAGAEVAVSTGGSEPLGIAIGTVACGAVSGAVRLCTF